MAFAGKLWPFDLLIELYPLVPFVLEVLIAQSVYIWTSSAWMPVTGAEAGGSEHPQNHRR